MDTKATKIVYGIEEAFDLLSVSRSRGFKLINEGLLETFKDGRRRMTTRKNMEKCAEAMQRASEKGKAA